jgi:hypothetical protein
MADAPSYHSMTQRQRELLENRAIQDTPHMQDTPELRARLHELGSKAYDYGHGSFSPEEAHEYEGLTGFYNFPRYAGSGHMTREDEDAAMLQHLQGNVGRGRTEETYATGGYARSYNIPHRADGGIIDKALDVVGGQVDPAVAPATSPVDIAQQTLAAPRPKFSIRRAGTAPAASAASQGYQFQQLEEGRANTNSLKDAFQKGIARHLALPEGERIVNSRNAIKALEPYMGTRKDGKPIALLSQNAKLLKAQTGTDEKKPIELDDGRGVETIGLSLYPDYREGEMKLCPNSASCRDECLGKTSGQYSEAFSGSQEKKGGISVRKRALNRTMAMMREPEAFAVRLWDDIESARREAERNGNHLGVRLNTLSDINPIVHKSIIESQPDVSFYDYTKMGWNPVAENHHYTHSSTGLTQDEVQNPHSNWNKMRRKLDQGDNVAMVFTNKGKQIPNFVHDQETGKKYRVIDGRTHDFRPLDMLENEGTDGQIVGLSNLKSTGQRDNAHIDSNGFFVKYDSKVHGDTLPIIPQTKVRG